LQHPNKADTEIDEVKDQLRKLQDSIQRELTQADKRITKIENKLAKRVETSRRSSVAIHNVWSDREEKVSEMIGGWVEEYE
jgi:uncharacterized protein YlxW (UPF0749 family)